MSKLFYRFRNIDSLIGERNELESQTIYFADPKQLNDPMEGYRDIYWHGDFIVWKNLFKHYLLCLERFCNLLSIAGETIPLNEDEIPVFLAESDLPTPEYKNLFSEVVSTFFSTQNVLTLIKGISERSSPVRRDELFFYLKSVHAIALEAIYKAYSQHGLGTYKENNEIKSNQGISQILESNWFDILKLSLKEKANSNDISNTLFFAQKHLFTQFDIINRYKITNEQVHKNRDLVLLDFPEKYITKLEKLIYPEWYVSCFMSEFRSSSVWGHYGDSHTGVCLIFKSDISGDDFQIKLNTINGWGSSGPLYGDVCHTFKQVDYIQGFGEVDFFRSLGRLPIPKLNATWYLDDGKMSVCAEEMLSDVDAWRKRYWQNFYRDILIKSKDWEYENEYRLILSSTLNSFTETKDRLLKYDFESLSGLIFGIKTETEDKVKIMKIIESKCKALGRNDFKFYQARYSSKDKCIVADEMDLIKLD